MDTDKRDDAYPGHLSRIARDALLCPDEHGRTITISVSAWPREIDGEFAGMSRRRST
jgi:hypothetical protein